MFTHVLPFYYYDSGLCYRGTAKFEIWLYEKNIVSSSISTNFQKLHKCLSAKSCNM